MTNGPHTRVRLRRSPQLPTCSLPTTEAAGTPYPPSQKVAADTAPAPGAFPALLPSSRRAEAPAQVQDTLTVNSSSSSSGPRSRSGAAAPPEPCPGASPQPRLLGTAGPLSAGSAPLPWDPSQVGSLRRLHRRRGAGATRTHTHTRTLTRAPPLAHSLHTHMLLSLASRTPSQTHTRCRRERQENEIYY